MRVEFHGLQFDLPPAWTDITDDLPPGSPPTLARPEGVGVIQFSLAKYAGGESPGVTIDALQNLLEDFCHRNSLECRMSVESDANMLSVKSTSVTDGELISVWYLSNGRDVLLATYVCTDVENVEMDGELLDADNIFRSIQIPS